MNKKETPTKAKNVEELFHHFAHGVFEEETLGNYTYDSRVLKYTKYYHKQGIIGVKFIKDRVFIINSDFNNGGTYGNHISSWHLTKAIHDYYTCIYVESDYIKELIKYNTIKAIPKILLYKSIFSSMSWRIADMYAKHLDLISTNSKFAPYSFRYHNHDNPTFTSLTLENIKQRYRQSHNYLPIFTALDELKQHINVDKFLKWSPKTKAMYTKYKGWTKESDYVYLDKPLKYYINCADNITEKELEEINFKIWKYTAYNILSTLEITVENFYYGHISSVGRGTYRKIYDNPEYKTKFEKALLLQKANLDNRRQAKKLERERKRLEEVKQDLKRWLNGEHVNSYNLHTIPVHLRIKDASVQTTMSASVPIEHAKLLFKKFKSCIETNTPWYTNGSSIKVGHYRVSKIDVLEGMWYIRAGCHIIYQEQIEDFITRNNLNW